MAAFQSISENPGVPQGTKPLCHQVCGHGTVKRNALISFLQTEDNSLLKRLQPPPRGPRELQFYKTVYDKKADSDPILACLKNLLPIFYGTRKFSSFPDEQYIHLEDITVGFEKPSIADIKMGTQTYDPEASAEKIQYEKSKYQSLESIGFGMGFRVYRPSSSTFDFICRKKLRLLDQFEILEKGIGDYFNLSEKLRKDAILAILVELKDIKDWFESQQRFAFYSTSLLCVYEGCRLCDQHQAVVDSQLKDTAAATDHHNQTAVAGLKNSNHVAPRSYFRDGCVKVKMIDFGHVYPTSERDTNYLFGLDNLMSYLETLLRDF